MADGPERGKNSRNPPREKRRAKRENKTEQFLREHRRKTIRGITRVDIRIAGSPSVSMLPGHHHQQQTLDPKRIALVDARTSGTKLADRPDRASHVCP